MKKNTVNEIENISLSAKQIKSKLEDALSYDHDKLRNINILFAEKSSPNQKLPFCDFKISISEEMYGQQLLLEDIKKHVESLKMIEENVEVEVAVEEPDVLMEEDEEMHAIPPTNTIKPEDDVNIVEEICEFDEIVEDDEEDEDEDEIQYAQLPYSGRAKRPKGYTIKVVDIEAVIKKIKDEAIAKNEGKPVIGRRQINKLLKPYMLKSDHSMDIDGIENSLTSIDIYLNAVDKINTTAEFSTNKNSSNTLELNINDILQDLENKK
jgi:hypothetical protein